MGVRLSASNQISETQILAALLGIAEMVGDLTDARELLEAVVRIAPGLVRVDRGAILEHDETLREFRTLVFFGPRGAGSPFDGLRIADADMPRLAQRVVSLHLPVLVKPDSTDHALPVAVVKRLGLKSALLVPLVCRGHALGVLWLDDSGHSHYFTSKEINVAQGVATSVALALDGAARRSELALERRRFEALARSVAAGVIVLDADHRILQMDRSAEELLGWQSSDVRGRRAPEVFAITEAEASVAWTREAQGPLPAPKALSLRSRAGGSVLCDVLALPIRGDEGGIVQVLYVLRTPPGTHREGPPSEPAPIHV